MSQRSLTNLALDLRYLYGCIMHNNVRCAYSNSFAAQKETLVSCMGGSTQVPLKSCSLADALLSKSQTFQHQTVDSGAPAR